MRVCNQSWKRAISSPEVVEGRVVQETAHCVQLISPEEGGIPMQYFAHGGNTCSLNKAGPELLPHVLNGIHSDGVDTEGRNEVLDPGV